MSASSVLVSMPLSVAVARFSRCKTSARFNRAWIALQIALRTSVLFNRTWSDTHLLRLDLWFQSISDCLFCFCAVHSGFRFRFGAEHDGGVSLQNAADARRRIRIFSFIPLNLHAPKRTIKKRAFETRFRYFCQIYLSDWECQKAHWFVIVL